MMAKPMKILELHYPMIQFLIIVYIVYIQSGDFGHSVIFVMYMYISEKKHH